MGKKNDSSKPVAAETPAPKSILPAPAASVPPAAAPAAPLDVKPLKKEPKKKAVVKTVAKKAAKPKAKKTSEFSADDIALRAYFIAEHRHQHGLHGDSHSDWVEAERQLKAESKAAKKKVKKG